MEKTVEVPLEDWVKKIVEETAVIAVERAIEHHADSCPLNTDLRAKIMGNGKPSWDVRIDRLERCVKIALWVFTPAYLAAVGVFIKELISHFA